MQNNYQPNRIKVAFEIVLPVLLVLLLSWLFGLLLGSWQKSGDWHLLFYGEFIFWAVAGILYVYSRRINHQPFLLWSEQPYSVNFYLKSIIVLYLLVMASGIIATLPTLLGLHENRKVFDQLIRLIKQSYLLMIFGAITAGVTEELLVRGFILPRMQWLFNSKAAGLILSSLLFSALHYKYHSLHEFIFTFLVGLVLGFHYQKYKNIKIVMITHFLIDMIAFLLQAHIHRLH